MSRPERTVATIGSIVETVVDAYLQAVDAEAPASKSRGTSWHALLDRLGEQNDLS